MKIQNRSIRWISAVLLCTVLFSAVLPVTVFAESADEVRAELPFTDIPADNPYYDAIVYCYDNVIFRGTSGTTFEPDKEMTRSMVVTVFANVEEIDISLYQKTSFEDVKLGQWYVPYIEWATQNKVVNGYGNGNFGPNDMINVEQALQILYNYSGETFEASDSFDGFADTAEISGWAAAAVQWAVDRGIYAGTDGLLDPKGSVPRALMADLMCNYSLYRRAQGMTADIVYGDSIGGGMNTIADVYYNDAMFAADSGSYQHDIAKLALAMACAANPVNGEDITAQIKAAYAQLGFTEEQYYYYDKPLTAEDDTAAHSFAQKLIYLDGEKYLLVTAIGRGSGYGAEWVSNGNVGADGDHAGFAAAAADIYAHLQTYLADTASDFDTSKIKFLLTGFSRSAAVANALAALLNADNAYLDENIYAYTFATPNVTDTADTASNIYNIINPHDLVTMIPMEQMGFDRNGTDILLPYAQNLTDDAAYAAFDAYFASLTEQRESAEYLANYDFAGQYRAVGLLAELISGVFVDRQTFYQKYQTTAQDLLRDSFAGEGDRSGDLDLTVLLIGLIDPNGMYTGMLGSSMTPEAMIDFYLTYKGVEASLRQDAKTFLANGGAYVAAAHRQEAYISWMFTLDADDMAALAAK